MQKQSIRKYFDKEGDRLIYFETRQMMAMKERREMEAEELRKKSVSVGVALTVQTHDSDEIRFHRFE